MGVTKILDNVKRVIIGKEKVATEFLVGILCGGHILIEDVPGVGKTTLGEAFARTLGCTFCRIQFTPDLMPSDITGVSVLDRASGEFSYRPGPIMNQIILADEINRTSPKTQSSLLEAMAEGQVSVDGVTHALPVPFIVIATQNPVEYEGTYPLPEAQLDRFMLRLSIGYPDFEDERRIVSLTSVKDALKALQSVLTPEELLTLQERVLEVSVAGILESYIVELTQSTRTHPDVLLGVSPRGGQHLYRAAKGLAFIDGRNYVLPDDIKAILPAVFSHRLILKPDALLKGVGPGDVIADALSTTRVPVMPHGSK